MPSVDFPDWTRGYTIVPGSLYGVTAQDFPDWTDGITAITGTITPGQDFPDWVKAIANATATTPLTGMLVWHDATQIVGHVDGDALTTVPDLSGNGYNATGSTAHYWTSTTANIINGHPAFTIDSGGGSIAWRFPATSQPFTMFFVAQTAVFTGSQYLWSNTDGAPFSSFIDTSAALQMNNAGGGFATPPTIDTKAHVFSYIMTGGAGSEVLLDGAVKNTGNGGSKTIGSGWFGRSTGGTGTNWLGPMGEILVYNFAMTVNQHAAVYTYLQNKWGTP